MYTLGTYKKAIPRAYFEDKNGKDWYFRYETIDSGSFEATQLMPNIEMIANTKVIQVMRIDIPFFINGVIYLENGLKKRVSNLVPIEDDGKAMFSHGLKGYRLALVGIGK